MANGRTYDSITTLLLRLFFGSIFLLAGLGKLANPAAFQQFIEKDYANTFLAGPLLTVFGYALPFVETALGVLLLPGLLTRPAFVGAVATLVVLFFGKLVAHDTVTSAQIALYFLIAVYAVRHSEANKFSVDHLIHRAK